MYQTTTKVKIDKEVYDVGYPNVGQQLAIEALKELLSNNKYAQLAATGSKTALQLLDFIDAVSYFTVLIPAIKEKIDLKNFTSADPVFQRKLSKAYLKYNSEFVIPMEQEINKELELEDSEIEG
jgi:hypothetical protein